VSAPLPVDVSELAAGHIRTAESWWRRNRPKAPNAIREELERATALIAIQPGIGTQARNARLAGVRRVHLSRIRYELYYRVVEEPRRVELLAFWHASRGSGPPI
jgi:plasmid stabilization system protein ParE